MHDLTEKQVMTVLPSLTVSSHGAIGGKYPADVDRPSQLRSV
jgi:hypothetical protein